jgi:(R,R)-butanediol dehydrogenase / meso-butanediol dehydrogenase / diacetyl reductase
MHVAVYAGRRTFEIEERPAPEPGPGEVTIDVAYTGICGTDLHIFHGDMDARVGERAVLGHEMSGRIAAVGPGVEGWSPGDVVTVMPLRWCGSCPACLAGNEHICLNLSFLGIDAPGALQGRWTVPEDILVRVPDGVPLRDAALVEPLSVAVHDVRRAALVAGERVLVVGGGPVGLLIAAVARDAGADVLLVEPNPHRLAIAGRFGVRGIDPTATDVDATVQEWTGGAGADVAFEVSGVQAGVDTAVAALCARGRMVLVAIHSVRRPVDLHRFFWRELTLVGARLYRREDVETAVGLVASGRVPVGELVSRVEPLDRVEAAFAALEAGDGAMKVLVDCGATTGPQSAPTSPEVQP